jgi:hypothetical protein
MDNEYQFIKLYAEVYTFTISHDFQMHGFATPQNTRNHIKPFKSSSNKLGSLDSLGRQM